MGRWTRQDATVCIFGTVNCAFGENTSDARRIVDAHNADCAAYEKRIAELEAKLALLQDTVPKDSMINLSTNEGQWMLSVWRILYPVETRT